MGWTSSLLPAHLKTKEGLGAALLLTTGRTGPGDSPLEGTGWHGFCC